MSALTTVVPAQTISADIANQLGRMLDSACFRRSPRLSRFLQFVVQESLRREEWKLKEYSIAVEVFRKPDNFDPRLDSAVRVAARQLRAKLERYYAGEGRADRIMIRFRPGDYVPRISVRERESEPAGSSVPKVMIVDGDRRGAHALAECLDPAACRVTAVTNDITRALALLAETRHVVVMAGISVYGGLTGCELLRSIQDRKDVARVAVVSSTSTGALISQVVACQPDAVVFKPLRQPDVETAVRFATIRMAQRTSESTESGA